MKSRTWKENFKTVADDKVKDRVNEQHHEQSEQWDLHVVGLNEDVWSKQGCVSNKLKKNIELLK